HDPHRRIHPCAQHLRLPRRNPRQPRPRKHHSILRPTPNENSNPPSHRPVAGQGLVSGDAGSNRPPHSRVPGPNPHTASSCATDPVSVFAPSASKQQNRPKRSRPPFRPTKPGNGTGRERFGPLRGENAHATGPKTHPNPSTQPNHSREAKTDPNQLPTQPQQGLVSANAG